MVTQEDLDQNTDGSSTGAETSNDTNSLQTTIMVLNQKIKKLQTEADKVTSMKDKVKDIEDQMMKLRQEKKEVEVKNEDLLL